VKGVAIDTKIVFSIYLVFLKFSFPLAAPFVVLAFHIKSQDFLVKSIVRDITLV